MLDIGGYLLRTETVVGVGPVAKAKDGQGFELRVFVTGLPLFVFVFKTAEEAKAAQFTVSAEIKLAEATRAKPAAEINFPKALEITRMPRRKRVTKVHRGKDGQILDTTQIEKDD